MKIIPVFNLDFYQSEIDFTFPKEAKSDKHYINCDFSSTLYNSHLKIRGKFRNCVFVNCDFRNLKIKGKFENCNFAGSVFEGVQFEGPEFYRCDFSGTIFKSPTGVYTCKFKDTCKFEFSQGLSISPPDTDERILIVARKSYGGVSKFVGTEKTEKTVITTDPYDTYEVNGEDEGEGCDTGHGRRRIGFSTKRQIESCRGRKGPVVTRDESAVLICSREGLI